ncbi:M16 family metallopeptidase [Capnocytophaga canimorsus]|uniref:M16 family metallopeptidase n=1 Tax=Capnocytophaga canimorsus TaxID=28188 RepID=UPI000D6E28A6|nr:pitrilysin family protein [Capnocytophaga canimorsus]AWL79527.1 peptidase M16 [Capnocytophaga canimorsus]AYW37151.1 insulinase family protein [Capnocytophaga canimorsus]MDT9499896.1 insulinase family protein [Capnocytophaga canimorsus]
MAQEVAFEEYDLANGLHVILHQDNSAPVVTTGVMYHVGAKDEDPTRTGFAHFFEHLLFEGTKNIERGKWFDIVSSNGGRNNAFTTQDKTYYYEVFPSNNLELALWMESERLLHPVINQVGVDTQNEVVKEEKRQRIDNAPYGKIIYRTGVNPRLFKKHPYGQSVIGSMEHLDAATLDEFIAFKKKFYNPNNAVLVVAGDINIAQTKKWIEKYFGKIPNTAAKPKRVDIQEEPIKQTIKVTEYDANIQIPMKLYAYRTPGMKEKDAYVLNLISSILSGGKSSRLYKKMVDDKKSALQVLAFSDSQEDYGTYIIGALPMAGVSLDDLGKDIDQEIEKLQNQLISEREFEKLRNQIETNFVNSNQSTEGIALSLADYYTFYKDTNLINKSVEIYRSITREDIQRAAREYLNPNQRLDLDYLPESAKK